MRKVKRTSHCQVAAKFEMPRAGFYFFSKYTLLIMLLQLSLSFPPLYFPLPCSPPPTSIPHPLSSWVVHIRSLASPFPILFLTSPCLFSTYHLCFSFPVPFPLFSLHPFPADNPPCDLHFCDSVPVLVVCLVGFVLGSVVDSCEFVVILLFIFLIIFFFLDKSL